MKKLKMKNEAKSDLIWSVIGLVVFAAAAAFCFWQSCQNAAAIAAM